MRLIEALPHLFNCPAKQCHTVAYLRSPAGAGSIWPAEGMAKEYSSFLEYDHDSGQNSDEKPRPKHIVVAGQFAAALQQSFAPGPLHNLKWWQPAHRRSLWL